MNIMIKEHKGYLFKDREISWMLFNERVLQEAENTSTPLLERLKFLAIFSSNNDEFFRVRVASLRRLQQLSKKKMSETQFSPDEVISEIQRIAVVQQDKFNKAYDSILKELSAKNIFIINEKELSEQQKDTVKVFFKTDVLPYLVPIVIDDLKDVPHLRDRSIYLAVRMSDSKNDILPKHAIIEIPTSPINRFYIFPKQDGKTYIMFVDDVIRSSLKNIFSIFDYDTFEAYTIKLTRDAEFTLDITEDYKESLMVKIQKSLKQRSIGKPTRFIFDSSMPHSLQNLLINKLQLKSVNLIPGGRYHNFKDFMSFPKVGNDIDYYQPIIQIPNKELDGAKTIFEVVSKKDIILHHPYQSFDYVIRMLREAAIDPNVQAIKITLYRVAKHSNIVNALINAVKNGKKVTVLMELQARFDEEANIYWTTQLQEAGARVQFGKPGQKVHSKLCVIYRNEDGKLKRYAHLSTGNYNGVTARQYCDHGIFTKDERITDDLEKLIDVLFSGTKKHKFNHLLVAPDYMQSEFISLIETEMNNAKMGKPAYIIAKMNSLVEDTLVKKLYEASRAGVKIDLIVRGTCSVVTGVKKLSENIRMISIIDRFLEHARVYIFCNGGTEKIYLASSDWMNRNLHNRVECAFPVFDENIKKEIKDIINIQLTDNVKARLIDMNDDNKYVQNSNPPTRAQVAIYDYLKNKYNP